MPVDLSNAAALSATLISYPLCLKLGLTAVICQDNLGLVTPIPKGLQWYSQVRPDKVTLEPTIENGKRSNTSNGIQWIFLRHAGNGVDFLIMIILV